MRSHVFSWAGEAGWSSSRSRFVARKSAEEEEWEKEYTALRNLHYQQED